MEKQYSSCLEMFGGGMVVYWYGYVETIREIEPRLFVVDHDFFPESHTKGLFEG
ncbi:MAG: TPD domain-containing protein [Candidatus Hydrothermarchaeaceae archaeon]